MLRDIKTLTEMTTPELLELDAQIGNVLDSPRIGPAGKRFALDYRRRCRAELERRHDQHQETQP